MKNTETIEVSKTKLDLEKLQETLVLLCSTLNMPLRKTIIHTFIREVFDFGNSIKNIDFALLDLTEQGILIQSSFFICSPECSSSGRTIPTATEEGIAKFLASKSMKEEIKHDLFFSPMATDRITPQQFYKYVTLKYPALLAGTDAALAYMEQLEKILTYGLSDNFYAELNDYPTNRWFSSFFNQDCRIVIKNIDQHKNHINIQLLLLPGKRRSYQLSHEQFEELKDNLSVYFDKSIHLHIKTTLLTMITGTRPRRKKGR